MNKPTVRALCARIAFGFCLIFASLQLLAPTTGSPLGAAPVAAASAWAPNTWYAVGAQVTYGGRLYQCIQAHTTQVGWEPPNVPALWQDRGPDTGGTATSTKTATRTTGTVTRTRTRTASRTPTGPTVTRTPTRTTTPTMSTPSATPAWLPDLLITDMQLTLTGPCTNPVATLRLQIANQGGSTSGEFNITATYGSTGSSSASHGGLTAGASGSFDMQVKTIGGTITATIDSGGQVVESNEGNNQLTRSFPMPAACVPTATPTAIPAGIAGQVDAKMYGCGAPPPTQLPTQTATPRPTVDCGPWPINNFTATIRVYMAGTTQQVAQTSNSADGSYAIALPAGVYRVVASPPSTYNWAGPQSKDNVVVSSGMVTTVNFSFVIAAP